MSDRTIIQTATGWAVVNGAGEVMQEFATHAEAWRYLDRNDASDDAYDRIRQCFNGGYQRGGA